MAPAATDTGFVIVSTQNGISLIPNPTTLTRLHYFDGKFLRADDLSREQDYLRNLVALSNQSGGAGVVQGFSVMLDPNADAILISQGLAIDPTGRVLLLPTPQVSVGIADLIAASMTPPASTTTSATNAATNGFAPCTVAATAPAGGSSTPSTTDLYVITVGLAEALCGTESVYGKLCEEACVTSTDRPYTLEGIIVRAVPYSLVVQPPVSAAFPVNGDLWYQSRVAASYFADEASRIGSLLSASGLADMTWCYGACPVGGSDVAIAMLGRSGATTRFLDPWIVRRERLETPPRRYWQLKMSMRPLDIFWAQVFQFQCQLVHALANAPELSASATAMPSQASTAALAQATQLLQKISLSMQSGAAFEGGTAAIDTVLTQISGALQGTFNGPTDRVLLRHGIVELPSAGYLPVSLSSTKTVNEQVRQLLGDGLDYNFCVVRHDYVPHAFEEAQHMDRISLLHGLDVPAEKPEIDVLVPDGQIQPFGVAQALTYQVTNAIVLIKNNTTTSATIGSAAAATVGPAANLDTTTGGGVTATIAPGNPALGTIEFASMRQVFVAQGAARAEVLPSGGAGFYTAVISTQPPPVGADTGAAWVAIRTEENPLKMSVGELTPVSGRLIAAITVAVDGDKTGFTDVTIRGDFQVTQVIAPLGQNPLTVKGVLSVVAQATDNTSTGNPGCGTASITTTLTFQGDAKTGAFTGLGIDTTNNDSTQFQLNVNWKGTPLNINVDGRVLDSKGVNQGGPVMTMVQDPTVLDPTSKWQILGRNAISVIAAATNDTLFGASAPKLLFPAAPTDTAELVVVPTLPWVMFHRRRTKICSLAQEPVAAIAPTRLQVLYVPAIPATGEWNRQGPIPVNIISAALNGKGTQITLQEVINAAQAVDILDFPYHLASPVAGTGGFLADWRNAHGGNPGNYLLGSFIASDIPTDDNQTGTTRLSVLESAMSSVTDTSLAVGHESVLQNLIPGLGAGTDGFILFAVLARRCQNIYQLGQDSADMQGLARGDLTSASNNGNYVDVASFLYGTPNFDSSNTAGNLQSDWSNNYNDQIPIAVYVVYGKGASVAAEQPQLVARANTVLAAIGFPNSNNQIPITAVEESDGAGNVATDGTDCPVWTVIVTKTKVTTRTAWVTYIDLVRGVSGTQPGSFSGWLTYMQQNGVPSVGDYPNTNNSYRYVDASNTFIYNADDTVQTQNIAGGTVSAVCKYAQGVLNQDFYDSMLFMAITPENGGSAQTRMQNFMNLLGPYACGTINVSNALEPPPLNDPVLAALKKDQGFSPDDVIYFLRTNSG